MTKIYNENDKHQTRLGMLFNLTMAFPILHRKRFDCMVQPGLQSWYKHLDQLPHLDQAAWLSGVSARGIYEPSG